MARIFIALPVPSAVQEELIKVQKNIKRAYPDFPIKWTAIGNFHITLEFLGELSNFEILKIREVLDIIVPNYPSFDCSFGEISGFPNSVKPNIIIIKVLNIDRSAFALQKDLHEQLKEKRLIKTGRPWRPHLSLGRIKAAKRFNNLNKLEGSSKIWKTDRVILYESKLSQGGSIYKPISQYYLAKN